MSEDIDFLHPPKDTDDKEKNRKESFDFVSFHVPEEEKTQKDRFIDKVKIYFRNFLNSWKKNTEPKGKKKESLHKLKHKKSIRKKHIVGTHVSKIVSTGKDKVDTIGNRWKTKDKDIDRNIVSRVSESEIAEGGDSIDVDVNLAPTDNVGWRLGLYIRIGIVVIVFIVTSMYGYKSVSSYRMEHKNIQQIKSRIAEIEEDIGSFMNSESVKNKLEFYIRKDLFITIYGKIIQTSRLFEWLESIVVDGVVFNGFDFNSNEGVLIIKAKATDYEKAVWQWYLFDKSDFVKDVEVSNIGKDKGKDVGDVEESSSVDILFRITLDINKFKIQSD